MTRVPVSIVLLASAVLIAGCGGDDDPAYEPPTLVHVVADEAIRQPMIYLKTDWDDNHTERVVFQFSPTTDMVAAARGDGEADVLVTDDLAAMNAAKADGLLAADPVAVATNRIVLGVPTNSPITGLSGLDGVRWIECTASTACGRTTRAVQAENGFTDKPYQRREPMDILPRVISGQAAAGFMWASEASEVAADPLIRTVEIPGAADHRVTYYMAPLSRAEQPDAARDFVALATSDTGRALIERGRFDLP